MCCISASTASLQHKLLSCAQVDGAQPASISTDELLDILKDQRGGKDEAQTGVVSDEVQHHACMHHHPAVICSRLAVSNQIFPSSCSASLHRSDQFSCTAQMLEKLLDRRHLEEHVPAPHACSGVGYEVIQAKKSGLLSSVE